MRYTIAQGGKLTQHKQPEKPTSDSKEKNEFDYMRYTNLGAYFVTPIVLFLILGIYADTKFATKPIFTLAGIAFGFLCSFYQLYKFAKEQKD